MSGSISLAFVWQKMIGDRIRCVSSMILRRLGSPIRASSVWGTVRDDCLRRTLFPVLFYPGRVASRPSFPR